MSDLSSYAFTWRAGERAGQHCDAAGSAIARAVIPVDAYHRVIDPIAHYWCNGSQSHEVTQPLRTVELEDIGRVAVARAEWRCSGV